MGKGVGTRWDSLLSHPDSCPTDGVHLIIVWKSTMGRPSSPGTTMLEEIARAIATADGVEFEDDPARFRRLALGALRPMARPTDTMVDAAHEAVSFDGAWAIRGRSDFRKAMRAMVRTAMVE